MSTNFKVAVTGEAVAVEKTDLVLTSGSKGVYTAIYTTDAFWGGLTLEAVFIAAPPAWPTNPSARDIVRRSVPLADGSAFVHPDVLAKPGLRLWVGLQGLDAEGTIVKNSTLALVDKIQHGADPDGPGDGDVPETRYEELRRIIQQISTELSAQIEQVGENGNDADKELLMRINAVQSMIPDSVSQLENDSGFVSRTVNNLVNYYLKSDTYSKTEIDNKLSLIPKFSIEVVDSLPTTNISDTTIYLVPAGNDEGNLFDEWIYINGEWEHLGAQMLDLSGYALKTDIPVKLSELVNDAGFITKEVSNLVNYYKKTEVDAIRTELEAAIEKAAQTGGSGGSGIHIGPDAPTDENIDVWIDTDEEPEGVGSGGSGCSGGINITGAEVGQTIKIAAVDENGMPTAWEAVDSENTEWEVINEMTLEEGVTSITINTDSNGNAFSLKQMKAYVCCTFEADALWYFYTQSVTNPNVSRRIPTGKYTLELFAELNGFIHLTPYTYGYESAKTTIRHAEASGVTQTIDQFRMTNFSSAILPVGTYIRILGVRA